KTSSPSRQTPNIFRPPFGSQPKTNGRAENRAKLILRHPSEAVFRAEWLKRCIKRARRSLSLHSFHWPREPTPKFQLRDLVSLSTHILAPHRAALLPKIHSSKAERIIYEIT